MSTYLIHRKVSGSVQTAAVRGDIKAAMLRFVEQCARTAPLQSDRSKWADLADVVRSSESAVLRGSKLATPNGTLSITTAPSIGAWVMRSDAPPKGWNAAGQVVR